jgi:putative phosphoesterase
MKLLILSDSHGRIERMAIAVEQVKPDAILHLGDHIGDAGKLCDRYPETPFYMVKGNCDINADGSTEQLFTLEGARILMAHGHKYKVKSGLTAFAYRAREAEADIAFYGHTHQASIQQANGIWFVNPGQMERHDSVRASYAVVMLERGNINIELKEIQTGGAYI